MTLRVNQDGHFFGRAVAAATGALPMLVIGALIWWADGRTEDVRAGEAIARLETRIDRVEGAANADRQRVAELTGDMRNVLRSTGRIEQMLDRMMEIKRPGGGN